VNPYDINGLKDALLEAIQAPEKERSRRMKALRKQVVENDIDAWANRFLDDLQHLRRTHDKTPRPARSESEPTGTGTRRR
jgi:trehalose 6-phosphate synthase